MFYESFYRVLLGVLLFFKKTLVLFLVWFCLGVFTILYDFQYYDITLKAMFSSENFVGLHSKTHQPKLVGGFLVIDCGNSVRKLKLKTGNAAMITTL
jgi:hypothetical protein